MNKDPDCEPNHNNSAELI